VLLARGLPKLRTPPELKALSKFLDSNGFTLAVPFDDIRRVGYIGSIDEKGRERIVDDGTCFKSMPKHKPGKIVLGDFDRQSVFSLKSFLKVFGSIFGIDAALQNAKSIALSFPEKFLQSNFFTEIEVGDALPKLSEPCHKAVTDPSNFVVTQTLETDAIQYVVRLKKKADANAQANLTKAIVAKAQGVKANVNVTWQGDTQYAITVSDPETRLTIGYKTMRVAAVPFKLR
jgi:hypothetical protein